MQDFLLDDNDDVLTDDGDFVIGESDEQHQRLMLLCNPGSFKNAPDGTVGIESYLMDDEIDEMLTAIRNVFKNDGCPVNSITYDETIGELNYNAKYS